MKHHLSCVCRVPEGTWEPAEAPLALRHDLSWQNGQTLRYFFFGSADFSSNNALRDLVRDGFRVWKEVGIGLSFVEVDNIYEAEIRIAFELGSGNWSYLGTEALHVPLDQPTMNIETVDRATIYHQLGHMLGFRHEFPGTDLRWNVNAVYESFASDPQNWNSELVDQFFLQWDVYPPPDRQFDVDSIMLYEVPEDWSPDKLPGSRNAELSPGDKHRARITYPALSEKPPIPDIDISMPHSTGTDHDPREITILFATNRGPSVSAGSNNDKHAEDNDAGSGLWAEQRQSGREKALKYGFVSVHIPEQHDIGKIERPKNFALFGFTFWTQSENKKSHFILGNAEVVDVNDFSTILRSFDEDSVLIFVHGYNTSFSESIFKLAQIVWDTQFAGAPIAFSWPSRATWADYDYDRASALFSRDAFLDVLRLASRNVSKAYVVAHSMGNQIVVDVLAKAAELELGLQLSEVVLAAPDVDKDVFTSLADRLRKAAAGVTLYASSADKALWASEIKAGRVPRAGDVPAAGPLVLPGIDTIDITAVGNDAFALNHGTYSSSRSVIEDIGRIISATGIVRPPHRRSTQLRRVPELSEQPRYWRFPK